VPTSSTRRIWGAGPFRTSQPGEGVGSRHGEARIPREARNRAAAAVRAWRRRVEATRESANAWDQAASAGELRVVYKFDHEVRDERHVRVEKDRVEIEGYGSIRL
jgi:hypothetical protein